MVNTKIGVEFDPGFAPYIMAFRGTVEYLYMDINRFKNLSQKKMKFKMYYRKFIDMLNNNVGFYIGCMMWASYIKTQDEQEILNNPCLGLPYDEADNISDTQYLLKFIELFPKDMKYFLSQDYVIDENIVKLIKLYEEFLVINKGFVETKLNTDLKIPTGFKTEKLKDFKASIDNAIKTGKLEKLIEFLPEVV